MLDGQQLRSFIMLAHECHFGRAASRLFVTQSALSRRIQHLELDLAVSLFSREGKRVELTAAGQAFLPEAEAILQRMEVARRAAQDAGGTLAGRISIGFDGAASYTLIPRLIAHAALHAPRIAIEFIELSSLDQMREVEFHRLDIGLVRPLAHEEAVLTTSIFSEPLALAVPADHRLARRRLPRLAELDGEPFVAYSEAGRYLRDMIDRQLGDAGVAPRIVQRMSRTHSILALVSTGMGMAIVPSGSRSAAFDNIVFKPLPLEVRAEWHAAWHSRAAGVVVAPMLDLLRTLDSPAHGELSMRIAHRHDDLSRLDRLIPED